MGLNYDLGDKSEILTKRNHFEKLNKTNRIFSCRKCKIFRVLGAYFGVQDWK